MILLMIYLIISCQSTNYYNVDVSGVKLDAFGKRGNYIDSIDNRINGRTNNYNIQSESQIQEMIREVKEDLSWEEEVKDVDAGLQELMTAISSAIAGVYCLVKVIINIVKKVKS